MSDARYTEETRTWWARRLTSSFWRVGLTRAMGGRGEGTAPGTSAGK